MTLSVQTTNDPNALAAALVGSGLLTSGLAIIPGSASYTGASTAVGTFTNGGTLGLGSGVILSSGNVSDAPEPSSDLATTSEGTAGNPALTSIAGAQTFDAATLTFQFTTTTGDISFSYIFGTEEYPEFVGQFNDVFGFFVDGQNIALVPGTTQPVSVNTVNSTTNSADFRDNTAATTPYNVVYGGLTTVLAATETGLSAGVHTITLSIADTGDSSYDSAVFLGAGSFSSNPTPVTPVTPTPTPVTPTPTPTPTPLPVPTPVPMPTVFSSVPGDANKPDGLAGTTPYVFGLSRGGDLSTAAAVTYVVSGIGTSPADPALFSNPTGTVNFAAGTQTINFAVLVNAAAITAPETFEVTLYNAAGQIVSIQTAVIQQNYTPAGLPAGFAIPGAGPADPTVGSGPLVAVVPPVNAVLSSPVESDVIAVSSTAVGVDRFFNAQTGAHFYTGSASEAKALVASMPSLTLEGLEFGAVDPAVSVSDPAAISVYRFFNYKNGSEFLTASSSERDQIVTTSNSLTYEGVAFYEDATQQANDVPVYRFFDTQNGTHFYTASASEVAAIKATRPDMTAEGISFYAPSLS